MNVTLKVSENRPHTMVADLPERAEFLIGRAEDCDLRLASPLVSRHHCMLTAQDGRIFLRDLESSNGTALNSRILVGRRQLHDGDELWVAATPIEIHIQRERSIAVIADEVSRTLWRREGAPGGRRTQVGPRKPPATAPRAGTPPASQLR